jgi:hypothetical protein
MIHRVPVWAAVAVLLVAGCSGASGPPPCAGERVGARCVAPALGAFVRCVGERARAMGAFEARVGEAAESLVRDDSTVASLRAALEAKYALEAPGLVPTIQSCDPSQAEPSATASAAVTAEFKWKTARDGSIPSGAPPAGVEQPPGRERLYACRARYQGEDGVSLLPGKVGPHLGSCSIAVDGREVGMATYEVLTTKVAWAKASGGALPDGVAEAGYEATGTGRKTQFLCRGTYPERTSGVHIGRIQRGFRGCVVGWGGAAVWLDKYEVATNLVAP